MARPTKNNAQYFSHDANMRNDEKIRALRHKYGHIGYAVWCFLLETLTAKENFEIQYTSLNRELFAADYDVSETDFDNIVEYLVHLNLLQLDGEILKCHNLIRRFEGLEELRATRKEAGKKGAQKRWQNNSKAMANDSKAMANALKGMANDSKENNSKENNNKEDDVDETRTREDGYNEFLKTFFSDTNKLQIETLLMQMHCDRATLEQAARETIAEWQLTQQAHDGYSDMARHLISQMRKKIIYSKEHGNHQRKDCRAADRRAGAGIAAVTAEDYKTAF